MFEHGAGRDFTETFALQAEALYHSGEHRRQHVEVAAVDILSILARKRDTYAAENSDGFRCLHFQLLTTAQRSWRTILSRTLHKPHNNFRRSKNSSLIKGT